MNTISNADNSSVSRQTSDDGRSGTWALGFALVYVAALLALFFVLVPSSKTPARIFAAPISPSAITLAANVAESPGDFGIASGYVGFNSSDVQARGLTDSGPASTTAQARDRRHPAIPTLALAPAGD
jgi:hypothetical protein